MRIEDVYAFYDSSHDIQDALGITRQALSNWKKRGYIPWEKQLWLQDITNGKLQASREHLKPEQLSKIYLPQFRYFDKKIGMCKVVSLYFNEGRKVRIVYKESLSDKKSYSTYIDDFLMQASHIKDINGNFVFEGDVVAYEGSKDKYYILKDIADTNVLQVLNKIEVIGHIYDGKNYGHN